MVWLLGKWFTAIGSKWLNRENDDTLILFRYLFSDNLYGYLFLVKKLIFGQLTVNTSQHSILGVVFSTQFLQHDHKINLLTESTLEHFPRLIDVIKLAGTSHYILITAII